MTYTTFITLQQSVFFPLKRRRRTSTTTTAAAAAAAITTAASSSESTTVNQSSAVRVGCQSVSQLIVHTHPTTHTLRVVDRLSKSFKLF
jgi:hypothetical protein